VHNISGVAVKVTAKTTGLINQAVESAVHKFSGGSTKSQSKSASGTPAQSYQYQPQLGVNGHPLPSRSRSPSPQPPPYSPPSSSSSAINTPPPQVPPRRLPLLNRVLLSTDLLLTTLESSGKHILEHGSTKLSEAVGHKYGKDAGTATLQLGQSATNVGLVYIDARGVGRRALIRRAGKTFVKAKLGKHDVEIGGGGVGVGANSNASSSNQASGAGTPIGKLKKD